ncbi:O-antigen translocase [Enterobacter asburiae]|uniref:O-antigen translocase n=1 Tax=Scandinavium sp. UTDF21-P1B TaxID=3446379 RepID=UPI00346A3F32
MKKLLGITVMSGIMTLIKIGIGFIIAKLIALYTGPTGMALLGQLQSLVTGVNGIANAPTSTGIVKYTAENHDNFEKCSPWWRASIYYTVIITLCFIPFLLFFSKDIAEWIFHDAQYRWIVVITVLTLPITSFGTAIISVLNGLQNYRFYILTGVVSAILSGVLISAMIVLWGIKGALVAASMQYVFIGLIAFVINSRQRWMKFSYWLGRTDSRANKDILEFVLMTAVSSVIIPVALIFIRNSLVSHAGWDSAGQWQAVWKISEVYLGVLTMALSVYYLPKLASLNSANEIKREINSVVLFVFPAIVLAALLIYLLRDYIILILFTPDFLAARDLFAIQLCGDVIKVISWLYAYPMLAKKATKYFIGTEFFFGFTWVLLSMLFIDKYGVLGANIAYAVNYVMYFLFVFFNLKRVISLR